MSVILFSWEDVGDTQFGFSLLADDPRVTVRTTCTVFKESANRKHAARQPPNHIVPWSQWIDASSHLSVTRAAGLLRHKIVGHHPSTPRPVGGVVKSERSSPYSSLPACTLGFKCQLLLCDNLSLPTCTLDLNH